MQFHDATTSIALKVTEAEPAELAIDQMLREQKKKKNQKELSSFTSSESNPTTNDLVFFTLTTGMLEKETRGRHDDELPVPDFAIEESQRSKYLERWYWWQHDQKEENEQKTNSAVEMLVTPTGLHSGMIQSTSLQPGNFYDDIEEIDRASTVATSSSTTSSETEVANAADVAIEATTTAAIEKKPESFFELEQPITKTMQAMHSGT